MAAEVGGGYSEERDVGSRRLWLPGQSEAAGYDDENTSPLWTVGEDGRIRTIGGLEPQQLVDEYDQYVLERAEREVRGPKYANTHFADILPKAGELLELDKLGYVMGQLAIYSYEVALPHLRFGLMGYQRVTVRCIDKLQNFEHPEKIAATMPVFFDELAKALHWHIEGIPYAVQGWYRPFYAKEAQAMPPAGGMIDFLATHIRYELGIALFRTYTQFAHKPDYTEGVNLLLNEVAHDIIDAYAEFHGLFGLVKEHFLNIALREIYNARDDAWNAFVDLCHVKDFDSYRSQREMMRRQTEQRQISGSRLASLALRFTTRVPEGWENDDGTPAVHPNLLAA